MGEAVMAMSVACARCGKKLLMPENLSGRKLKCPGCGASLNADDESKSPVEPKKNGAAPTAPTAPAAPTVAASEFNLPTPDAAPTEPEEDNPFADFRATPQV